MSFVTAIFLGFVQGVAEFLPISSSGHLAVLQGIFKMTDIEGGHLFFDVLLHFGTLVAVCVAYWKDIVEMVRELFAMVKNVKTKERTLPPARRLILLIIVATLPLFLVLPIKDYVEQLYYQTIFIGCALLLTGLILYLSDRVQKGNKTERSATVIDALIVGLSQAIAIIPGLSRSGTTISIGLVRGFDRQFAIKFSFLMSLPAVLGANIISLFDAIKAGIDASLVPMYLAGMLTAAIFGYLAIRLLKYIASKASFGGFAYYCFFAGTLTIILSVIS